ncbi:hypothetical protein EOS_30945 [Caballeronia mineralivorans PML1(12)]|uniref:Uncharacterized protein n=1 Tax=Caballeronia mineralivorans PML1(12) TaxID=908627 RepID=A0A0J1CPZ6_9BURK|nr:hypothetical protein EOS_30945 [Caballeronia mineralivorans PML1(12)]
MLLREATPEVKQLQWTVSDLKSEMINCQMCTEAISVVLRPSPVLLNLYDGSRRPMHETAERADISTEVVG